MNKKLFFVACLFAVFSINIKYCFSQTPSTEVVLMNIDEYPVVFELDIGDEYKFLRNVDGFITERTIKLISVVPSYYPDFWNFDRNTNREKYFFRSAEIQIEIDGKRVVLLHRPFEHPIKTYGLRVYVEAIKEWAIGGDLATLDGMRKSVRFSICTENQSWGPESLVYPLGKYRFRSSSYNNTWGSLVPYAPLYYHKGEDMGAIPDRLPVSSIISGLVTGTPLPHGDGASNGVIIEDPNGIIFRIAHMNVEHISQKLTLGYKINSGDHLGYTGSTWLGGRNQTHDPHLHVEMKYRKDNDTIQLSTYPYLMEAYLRDYSDPVVAVAGDYEWTTPGMLVELDGSRSISRCGENIKSYKWKLHNDSILDGVNVRLSYDSPGLYTEELIVETDKGDISRDFLQVRVWNPEGIGEFTKNTSFGWIYQYPIRNVKVGEPVMFWNKIHNTVGSVYIDFGDGSKKIKFYNSVAHPYMRPGRFVVNVVGRGLNDEPIIQKLEVVVEKNE